MTWCEVCRTNHPISWLATWDQAITVEILDSDYWPDAMAVRYGSDDRFVDWETS